MNNNYIFFFALKLLLMKCLIIFFTLFIGTSIYDILSSFIGRVLDYLLSLTNGGNDFGLLEGKNSGISIGKPLLTLNI